MNVDLPDGPNAAFVDDEDWHRQAATIAKVWALSQWWMGDLLNAAPSPDAINDLHWSSPLLEPRETAEVREIAASFEPHRRRDVPWAYHRRVQSALLPPDLQDFLLDTCSTLDLRFMHLQEMISRYLKDQRAKQIRADRESGDYVEGDGVITFHQQQ